MRQTGLAAAAAVAIALAIPAQALTVLETASAGPGVGHAGTALDQQYLGARFDLTNTTTITAIGGHIQRTSGMLFGAIVALASATDLPSFSPSDLENSAPTRLYLTFESPATLGETADLLLDADLTLDPGHYGLVFGGVAQGAGGEGRMSTTDIETGTPSYFFGDAGGWRDGGFSNARFVVEGEMIEGNETAAIPSISAVPLPPGMALLAGAMGLLAFRRRRS